MEVNTNTEYSNHFHTVLHSFCHLHSLTARKLDLTMTTLFQQTVYFICGILWGCCDNNYSKTHIMLLIWSYSRKVRLCISCLVERSSGLAPFRMMAQKRVRNAFARCGTQTGGSTVHSVVAVGSEMHSRLFAACVVVTSPVGGDMSANSMAGLRPLVGCRDVRCQTTLLPSGSSPTILPLLVVADKLPHVVWELAVHS